MARVDAARAVDMVLRQSDRAPPAPPSDRLPLPGGDIENFAAFEAEACRGVAAGRCDEQSARPAAQSRHRISSRPARARQLHHYECAGHENSHRRNSLCGESRNGRAPGRRGYAPDRSRRGLTPRPSSVARHRRRNGAAARMVSGASSSGLAAVERNLRRHLARDPNPDVASSDEPGNRAARAPDGAATPASVPSSDGAMLAESNVRATA